MTVTIHLSDGGTLDIADFDAETVLDLREELKTESWLTFDMDGATVVVNAKHVVRIDVEAGK